MNPFRLKLFLVSALAHQQRSKSEQDFTLFNINIVNHIMIPTYGVLKCNSLFREHIYFILKLIQVIKGLQLWPLLHTILLFFNSPSIYPSLYLCGFNRSEIRGQRGSEDN